MLGDGLDSGIDIDGIDHFHVRQGGRVPRQIEACGADDEISLAENIAGIIPAAEAAVEAVLERFAPLIATSR